MDEPTHLNDSLHGITLGKFLTDPVERQGGEELDRSVTARSFLIDPNIKLPRKTPWPRAKIEEINNQPVR
ncbi:MAG: VF530 family DNA-binding protein [Verrucomicrobia bacterium]|nr:VF530 family DNA-binding protein [Verrucomicrobiota bacterium]